MFRYHIMGCTGYDVKLKCLLSRLKKKAPLFCEYFEVWNASDLNING